MLLEWEGHRRPPALAKKEVGERVLNAAAAGNGTAIQGGGHKQQQAVHSSGRLLAEEWAWFEQVVDEMMHQQSGADFKFRPVLVDMVHNHMAAQVEPLTDD